MVVLDWGCGWGRKDAGRIYEASHAEAMDPAADARSLFASGFEGADLPALLRHPDRRVRIRASVLLAKERRDEQQFGRQRDHHGKQCVPDVETQDFDEQNRQAQSEPPIAEKRRDHAGLYIQQSAQNGCQHDYDSVEPRKSTR